MNPDDFKKAVDWAKKNPNDPRADELRKRIEAGTMNKELQSAGMKTFEVQPPPPTAYPTPTEEVDVEETEGQGFLGNIKQKFAERVDKGSNALLADQSKLSKGLQVVGQGAGFVGDLGFESIKSVTPDFIEEGVGEVAGKVAETAPVQGALSAWEKFKQENPEFAGNVEAAVNIVSLVPIGKGAAVTTQVAKKGAQKVPDVAAAAKGVVDEKLADMAANTAVRQAQQVDDAVGRILQGTPEDIAVGKRALSNIDTEGIQTYEQLNTRVDDRITALANKVDSELTKYPEKYRNEQLGKYTKVADETVVENPVVDAINGLEEAYTKSGEAVKAAELRQLKVKLNKEGLTVKELNDLARKYGTEFKDKAFTKLGDPKPGYNAENFENVRTGLKAVTRERMPDNVAKELDKQMSDLYQVKTLTTKMEQNVQKLYQKVKNRSLMQKLGGLVADAIDLASLGTARGFVQKLLPSNVGLKTANSLDLQEELARNLKKIERLLDDKATDEEVLQGVSEMIRKTP